MPLYDVRCESGHTAEVLVHPRAVLPACQECGATVRTVYGRVATAPRGDPESRALRGFLESAESEQGAYGREFDHPTLYRHARRAARTIERAG